MRASATDAMPSPRAAIQVMGLSGGSTGALPWIRLNWEMPAAMGIAAGTSSRVRSRSDVPPPAEWPIGNTVAASITPSSAPPGSPSAVACSVDRLVSDLRVGPGAGDRLTQHCGESPFEVVGGDDHEAP